MDVVSRCSNGSAMADLPKEKGAGDTVGALLVRRCKEGGGGELKVPALSFGSASCWLLYKITAVHRSSLLSFAT